MKLSSTKPTRTGYTFGHWTASIGGNYNPGANYTHDQDGGTVTMKASWNPWKHTITYNANGGSGAPANQTKTYGTALTLSSTKPTRTGYVFKGWSASIGGTYQAGGSYSHDQNGGTVTMTATWEPWKHTIKYDANGGSGAPANQTKTYGTALTLSGTKPTKTGYSFKGWDASIGGTYQPEGSYTHDQNGGTVTMKAKWEDDIKPSCSAFTAVPNAWSKGNGTISFTVRDQGSGLASVKLQRYSDVSKSWSDIKTWTYSGTTEAQSESYTETSEGVYYYKITIKDKAGNTNAKTSDTIYLDHSNPVILGTENTVTSWTKTAPVISVTATDYLTGTTYNGSGVKSLVIKNSSGEAMKAGISSASYTLSDSYQRTYTWTIAATDNVGHSSTKTVTTRFDKTGPECSSLTATPTSWSAGNGTVSFTARDSWSGLASAVLKRYSYVTETWSDVASWNLNNTTASVSKSYTETAEGVFSYKLVLTDALGNTSSKTTETIYLDHSNPVINGILNTVTDWTNVAPVIHVSSTDYLSGTGCNGSGLKSLVIKDDAGVTVASGVSSASYILAKKYEGMHTWTITATDNVNHTTTSTVTTKYDCTAPGIDGTEITFVRPDGITVSGYCQDNIISQHIDDEIRRSPNGANLSSGVKSVILYKVTGNTKTAINTGSTKKTFTASDTHSSFDMYHEITADEKRVSCYEIVVTDFAGNSIKKKLTSQYSLLSWFHTSIDRSSYR